MLVTQVCNDKAIDLDNLRHDAQLPIMQECFKQWLLKSYVGSVRDRISPIFAKSSDIEILSVVLTNKHHMKCSEIEVLSTEDIFILLGEDISEHNFTFDEEEALRSHDYSGLISEEWIHYHSDR